MGTKEWSLIRQELMGLQANPWHLQQPSVGSLWVGRCQQMVVIGVWRGLYGRIVGVSKHMHMHVCIHTLIYLCIYQSHIHSICMGCFLFRPSFVAGLGLACYKQTDIYIESSYCGCVGAHMIVLIGPHWMIEGPVLMIQTVGCNLPSLNFLSKKIM